MVWKAKQVGSEQGETSSSTQVEPEINQDVSS